MYCPSCRSEYRPGFTKCAHCKVDLVEVLPKTDTILPDELDQTRPVGRATASDVMRPLEINGRVLDLLRVFTLGPANEIRDLLLERGFPVLVVPVQDVDFPDQQPRFEVRVRAHAHEAAEATLRETWSEQVEAEGIEHEQPELDAEHCPACGANIPADAEECPDCGLYVGLAE